MYETAVEERLGREPKRRPGDRETALALVPTVTDGYEFNDVVKWAVHDDYTWQRLVNGGFQLFARIYTKLADKATADRARPSQFTPKDECLMHDRKVLYTGDQCPRCRADGRLAA